MITQTQIDEQNARLEIVLRAIYGESANITATEMGLPIAFVREVRSASGGLKQIALLQAAQRTRLSNAIKTTNWPRIDTGHEEAGD